MMLLEAPQDYLDFTLWKHLHLHHLEWFILDTVFAGVERHYGDESYFIVELLCVGLLCVSVWWLRKHMPLPQEDEEE